LCTLSGIYKDNAVINYIIVQHKKFHFRQIWRLKAMLVLK
jgi:hypothetical protein